VVLHNLRWIRVQSKDRLLYVFTTPLAIEQLEKFGDDNGLTAMLELADLSPYLQYLDCQWRATSDTEGYWELGDASAIAQSKQVGNNKGDGKGTALSTALLRVGGQNLCGMTLNWASPWTTDPDALAPGCVIFLSTSGESQSRSNFLCAFQHKDQKEH